MPSPDDPTETLDTDGDNLGNNADLDDDGDAQLDVHESACGSDPLDALSLATDFDADDVPDCVDLDDDNDGVEDTVDAFPLDPSESVDTDSDGVGDNADNCPAEPNADQSDSDGDGVGNVCGNTTPVADAGGPYLVAVGTSIELDDSASSDADGDALSPYWTALSGGSISGSTFHRRERARDLYARARRRRRHRRVGSGANDSGGLRPNRRLRHWGRSHRLACSGLHPPILL